MGRTKTSEREKMTASMEKKIGKTFLEGRWEWRGSRFVREESYYINGLRLCMQFVVNFQTVGATVNPDEAYGEASESRLFSGDGAIGECARWTAEKLAELYEEVAPRVAPYAAAHEQYLREIRGKFR